MATETSILAHSSFHFEDLQLSSKEFYQSLEDQLRAYEYPNLRIFRVSLSGGLFVGREYLCVRYKEHSFYVCAAPFGRSYFISWWLKERLSLWTVLLSHVPFFGARLARNSNGKSFYRIDTEQMFLESIKRIVNGLVDRLTDDKGFLNKE